MTQHDDIVQLGRVAEFAYDARHFWDSVLFMASDGAGPKSGEIEADELHAARKRRAEPPKVVRGSRHAGNGDDGASAACGRV